MNNEYYSSLFIFEYALRFQLLTDMHQFHILPISLFTANTSSLPKHFAVKEYVKFTQPSY